MPKINLNKLEIFYTIRAHFLKQGTLALDSEEGTCKYRTGDGRKCAVGALIPDEFYVPTYECNDIQFINAFASETFGEPLFAWEHERLLTLIQNVHDSIASRFEKNPDDGLNLFLEQLTYLQTYEVSEVPNA